MQLRLMKKMANNTSYLLPFFTILLFITFSTTSAEKDDISWEQTSKEVDNLLYSSTFIDSVKNAHTFSPFNRSIRKLAIHRKQKETLVYEIGWGPVKAGYIILSTDFNLADNTIKLGGKALSNNFVSAFYKMRDYILSTVDADGLYPLFFEQHLREGKKYKADRWMLFDNSAGKIHIKEKKFKTVETKDFVYDYLSILYYVRSMKTAPGDTFTLKTYTDSKIHPIYVNCGGKTDIKIDAGTFSCIRLEPKLAGDGKTFNKKDKLEVFISDDQNRLPVLIKSKIKFGSITAKLIWYELKPLSQ
ncbi:MAG TPA: DUF3108 domain-containing protein [Chitinispirillaceae bacterium]|nr:DUF3108 domain-containing protein [Chitinispirillaceae bacterium]